MTALEILLAAIVIALILFIWRNTNNQIQSLTKQVNRRIDAQEERIDEVEEHQFREILRVRSKSSDVVFLDLETTGLNQHGRDEIVEIGVVGPWGNVLMDQRVRPVKLKAWKEAEKIHGISPEDVADCPTLKEIEGDIIETIQGKVVAVYNAAFDMSFLPAEVQAEAKEFVCVMDLFRKIVPESRYRLQDALKWADGSTPDRSKQHSAVNDAQSMRKVWNTLAEKFEYK